LGPYIKDNIVALATPLGFGALAVIRVSGQSLNTLFNKVTGYKNPKPRYAYFKKFYSSDGDVLDNVLITYFKGPQSYTGEDVIEISCHGGSIISSMIIDELVIAGCRHAEPGEFSRRAYLNGKINITQAESIDLIIRSTHKNQAKNGMLSFEGGIKEDLIKVESAIYSLLEIIEHELDFTDEEITHTTKEEMNSSLKNILKLFTSLMKGGGHLNKINGGLRVCIVGEPNVGKSSLFNSILGYDKVVVSDQKGTTRDSIEAQLVVGELLFTLIDTAGYWEGKDDLDRLGIEKTIEVVKTCDIAIILDDKNPESFRMKIPEIENKTIINVISKADINKKIKKSEDTLIVSSKKGVGIDELLTHLSTIASNNFFPENSHITSFRQLALIKKARMSVLELIDCGSALDMVQISSSLRNCLDNIGEIVGKADNEKVLNKIFQGFCVGK
tara:strand:- start:11212 stop:12540 length:1329 start_codon:yes stop_codon:yes gene_type:complete